MLQPSRIPKSGSIQLGSFCCVTAAVLLLSSFLIAQLPGQKTFASPEEAGKALYAAVLADDQAAMLEIFGPEGNDIISTGDGSKDQDERDQFVTKYREMHRLAQESNGDITVYTGTEDWPFPVPLVNESGLWHFDTEAGKKEILYRRVGENEFAAINVCHVLVDAQNEYYSQPRDGRVKQYAQTLSSDEGQHNGLFWKAADGEPESPIGPLLANAEGGDGGKHHGESSPFHGYYFEILTGQGKTDRVSARSYLVNGEMIAGFAILAYPVEYGSSGVMTFVVDQAGLVYQKDLGEATTEAASAMKDYAPDESWKKAE
jgi:hypothetical protein